MTDSAMSTRSRVLFCALGASVMIGAASAAAVASMPSHSGTSTYSAVFGRAGQGLDARSDVKVRGVTVGNVESVALTPDGRVRVTMRVKDDVRVPAASEARVDPVSVFGPKEISLDLGASGPYLASGGTIARTKDPSDPSDTAWPLYRTGQALDPQDVTTLMHTFARGLSGQGPALRRTLGNGSKIIDATHADRAQIQQLLKDITGVSGTLQNRGGTLVSATRDLNAIAPAVSERPDQISRLLDEAGHLTTTVGGNLTDHGDSMGRLVDDGGRAAGVAARQNANLVTLADALNGFFGGLSGVMTAPGPAGTHPAVLRGQLPLDICQTIVDLCPTR